MRQNRNTAPAIRYGSNGSCVIRHTERIGLKLGSVGFEQTTFPLNPGLASTFPWLSGVASRFEKYMFSELHFEYRTKTSTSTVGDVIVAVDFDASDAAPSSSIQAEAYEDAVSTAPWADITNRSSRRNLTCRGPLYVRRTDAPSGTDQKLYDVGNAYVCTENQASAALVGYLYVTYNVELTTPQLVADPDFDRGGKILGAATFSAAKPLGSGGAIVAGTIGISYDTSTGAITYDYPGMYLYASNYIGTTLSAPAMAVSAGATATALALTINSAATSVTPVYVITITVAGATITPSLTAASVTAGFAFIASMPPITLP